MRVRREGMCNEERDRCEDNLNLNKNREDE